MDEYDNNLERILQNVACRTLTRFIARKLAKTGFLENKALKPQLKRIIYADRNLPQKNVLILFVVGLFALGGAIKISDIPDLAMSIEYNAVKGEIADAVNSSKIHRLSPAPIGRAVAAVFVTLRDQLDLERPINDLQVKFKDVEFIKNFKKICKNEKYIGHWLLGGLWKLAYLLDWIVKEDINEEMPIPYGKKVQQNIEEVFLIKGSPRQSWYVRVVDMIHRTLAELAQSTIYDVNTGIYYN